MTPSPIPSSEHAPRPETGGKILTAIRQEIARIVVGQDGLVDRLLLSLLCNGHVLIEGVPGLAKTLSVRTLAQSLHATFQRIQFTPDLLPGDVVGTLIYNPKSGDFHPHKGPIFAHVVLADEINRSPAKVQSALLEAMQERQVTLGNETHALPEPFLVLATQNPIEQEGTYPLPEAQLDRFMLKVKIGYPSIAQEHEIMRRMAATGVAHEAKPVAQVSDILALRDDLNRVGMKERLERYVLQLVDATRYPENHGHAELKGMLRHGASPRASIFLARCARGMALFAGRDYVVPDDIRAIAPDILRHRIALTYRAEAAGHTTDEIVQIILDTVPLPDAE
jgi:MoxR-like ATPase